jgi:hypothetical protein
MATNDFTSSFSEAANLMNNPIAQIGLDQAKK